MLDAKTGEPITTGGLRHGFRCAVAAMPGDSRWWTPEGLAVVEPGYVGCDITHLRSTSG